MKQWNRDLAPSRAKGVQVLELIDTAQATTRKALAEATGMQNATLNRLVAQLLTRGVLFEAEQLDEGRRGRPQARLALRPDHAAIVGLEFGRERLVGVVVDASGELRHIDKHLPVPDFAGTDATMGNIANTVRKLLNDAGFQPHQLAAAGIALHDVVTASGEWRIGGSNEGFQVNSALAEQLGCPVTADDVSRAFAQAEYRYGAGQGESDMIYLFLGSHGVGGGIFVNDHMLVSSAGICGEIGHVMVNEDGPLCQCGSVGCFETVASHRAVEARFAATLDQGVASSVDRSAPFQQICEAAGKGDKAAYLVLRELGEAMARALAATVNIVGAPTIVLGGPLRLAGEQFLDHVTVDLRQRVISGLSSHVSVRFASLPAYAGALGVAIGARESALHSGALLQDRNPQPSDPTDSAEGRMQLQSS